MSGLLLQGCALTKCYSGGTPAVGNCDVGVRAGRHTAVIGANGAGKTTLLNLLIGTMRPTAGEVRWFGRRLHECLPGLYDKIAFVPEEHAYYPRWTGEQTMRLVRRLRSRWDEQTEAKLRKTLGIPISRKIHTYSKGNLVRLSLLLALSQGAEVLIFDEPFSGFDPLIREELLGVISRQLSGSRQTLLFSSHDLFAAESLAVEVWILHKGVLLYSGPLAELLARYKTYFVDAGPTSEFTHRDTLFVREVSGSRGGRRFHVIAPSGCSVRQFLPQDGRIMSEKSATLQDAYAACVNLSRVEPS